MRPTGQAWRRHAPHGQQDKPGTTCQPRPDTLLTDFQRVASRSSLVPPTSRPNKTNLEFKSDQQDKSGTVKKETTFNCATKKRLREPSGQSSQGQGQMKYPRMS